MAPLIRTTDQREDLQTRAVVDRLDEYVSCPYVVVYKTNVRRKWDKK